MKTSLALLISAVMTHSLNAAELRIDCTGGRFFVDYIVSVGDSCSGQRTILIDGQPFVEPLPVITNGNRTILLDPTSTATITAQMSCITPSGFTDFTFVENGVNSTCMIFNP